jgi:hypothetical protein
MQRPPATAVKQVTSRTRPPQLAHRDSGAGGLGLDLESDRPAREVSYARRMSKHRRLPDVDPLRLLAGLHGAVCAGTVAYWAGFMAGSARTEESASYLDFERSF